MFTGLWKVEIILLNNNELLAIDSNAFIKTLSLKHMDLSSNKLLTVPSSLLSLFYFQTLNMSNNMIPRKNNMNITIIFGKSVLSRAHHLKTHPIQFLSVSFYCTLLHLFLK